MINNDFNISDLTFMQLWEEYNLRLKKDLKFESYRKTVSIFKNHLIPFFKNYLVVNINSKVYLKFLDNISQKKYAYSTKKNIHTAMVGILNYAVKFYDLEYNVASKVGGFSKKKEIPKKYIVWELEDFSTFINVVDNEIYYLLFTAMYFTGLRIGEALALNWNDFQGTFLSITKTLCKEKDEDGNYIINPPKTWSSIRDVPLHNDLINMINNYYKKINTSENFSNDWFIFGGVKPLSHTTVTRRFNKYIKKSGVKKIRLHDLRHSHATLLNAYHVPLTAISQRLGHSDVSITLSVYTHLIPQDINKTINSLNTISNDLKLFNDTHE